MVSYTIKIIKTQEENQTATMTKKTDSNGRQTEYRLKAALRAARRASVKKPDALKSRGIGPFQAFARQSLGL